MAASFVLFKNVKIIRDYPYIDIHSVSIDIARAEI